MYILLFDKNLKSHNVLKSSHAVVCDLQLVMCTWLKIHNSHVENGLAKKLEVIGITDTDNKTITPG